METKLLINAGNQVIFDLADHFDALRHITRIAIQQSQLQIALIVTPLALQQPGIELSQFVIQMRHQRGKTFTGTRLDKGTDD